MVLLRYIFRVDSWLLCAIFYGFKHCCIVLYFKGLSMVVTVVVSFQGLTFDGTQTVSFTDQYRGECFGNINMCYYGFTYTFWLYLYGTSGQGTSYTGDGVTGYFILSNGGQTSNSWGIAISYDALVVYFIAQTGTQYWGPIQYTAPAAGW